MAKKFKVLWLEPLKDVWKEGKKFLEENNCDVVIGREQTLPEPFTEEEVISLARDSNALLLVARERITKKIMENLSKLSIVVKAGIGVDNIDVKSATELGILVANTPVPSDYLGVAEGAVARILALSKNLAFSDRSVKEGLWLKEYDKLKGIYLRGKTLGIIGLGRIGSYVARLMKPFGVKILAYDPYVLKEKALLLDVELVDLPTLLRESDIISIHAVLTQETRRMISEKQLRMMKKSAFIINTARGPIIDEEALYRALKEGWIAGAALDVFEKEPPIDSPLLKEEISDKLLLSPHTSGLSEEMERDLTMAQVSCCLKAKEGIPPESTINPQAIERWKERLPNL
ncbi:MAG: hydroxyacid dehydrogenase [Nitrososphaerales archaeon]